MPPPTEEIFREISKDFNIHRNFPTCIKRIDAKSIIIHCPPAPSANILTTNSTLLHAVVDANLKFVTVDVKKKPRWSFPKLGCVS
jgi:hypothetical protein